MQWRVFSGNKEFLVGVFVLQLSCPVRLVPARRPVRSEHHCLCLCSPPCTALGSSVQPTHPSSWFRPLVATFSFDKLPSFAAKVVIVPFRIVLFLYSCGEFRGLGDVLESGPVFGQPSFSCREGVGFECVSV